MPMQSSIPKFYVRIRRGDFELEAGADEKAFVEKMIDAFDSTPKGGASHSIPAPSSNSERVDAKSKPTSVAEFKRHSKPQSASDFVACAAYFLEKRQNISEFTSKQLHQCLKDMKLDVKNPSDALAKARNAGYLMAGRTKGHFMLTDTGEQHVDGLIEAA